MNVAGWTTETIEACLERVSVPCVQKLGSKDYQTKGKYPIIDQGQGLIAGWTDDSQGLISTALPLIVFGDHTRILKYVDFAFVRGADGTQLVKPRAGIDPLYFYYACRSLDLPSRGYNRHFSLLKEQSISIPDFDEQINIAQILQEVERSIRIQADQRKAMQELKRSTMRELFTRGLRGEPRKGTKIGFVPESWNIVTIGDHASTVSKGASPKWQGFDYVDAGVLFVRSQNVGDGRMDWTEKTFLPTTWNEKEKRSILHSGDVLANLVGASIGRVAVGGAEIEGANCNQAVAFIRLKQDTFLPGFLAAFLLTHEGQNQIHESKKDIARANLSLEDIRNIHLPKPCIEEQREIVIIIDAVDLKIDLQTRKQAALEKLFKALLHKLMTGEIRVSELDLSALQPTLATGVSA